MKNLNPLYEVANQQNVDPNTGMSLGQGLALGYGVGAVTGVTSKYFRDKLLLNKILREYPDAMSFKNRLYRLPGESKEKTMLLVKLQPNTTREDYIKYLKQYLIGGSYLRSALGSIFSTAGNLMDMSKNASRTTDDAINMNVLRNEL